MLIHLGITPPDISLFCFAEVNGHINGCNHRSSKRKRSCFSDQLLDKLNIDCTLTTSKKHDLLIDYGEKAANHIRNRLSSYLQIDQQNNSEKYVTLTVSGMASIYAALRISQLEFLQRNKSTTEMTNYVKTGYDSSLEETQIVVFGFPYIDTLKVGINIDIHMQQYVG